MLSVSEVIQAYKVTQFLYDTGIGRFQREMVDTISSCGRTLLDSLEHIMDFAKINNFSKTSNNMIEKVNGMRKQEVESRRKRVLAASSLTASVDMNLVIEEVVEAVVLGFTTQHDFLHSEDAIAGIGVRVPNFTTKPQDLSKTNRAESIRGRVRLCLDLPATTSYFETQPGAWRRIVVSFSLSIAYHSSWPFKRKKPLHNKWCKTFCIGSGQKLLLTYLNNR